MRKSKKRVEHLNSISAKLEALEFDDWTTLADIRKEAEAFVLRVYGNDSPQQERVASIRFRPVGIIYNTGHYKNREAWDEGATRMESLLSSMRHDLTTYGNPPSPDGSDLPDPVSLGWLFRNVSWKVWTWFVAALITAFTLGVALGNTTFVRELLGR